MGMYSNFDYEDINVLDFEGLKRTLEIIRSNNDFCPYIFTKDMLELNEQEKTLSFEGWNDIKLISYWYDEIVLCLELISPYIEGKVSFTFETNDEGGYFEFENGKCIITKGTMNWDSFESEKFFSDLNFMKKQSKEIQKLRKDLNLVRTEKSI